MDSDLAAGMSIEQHCRDVPYSAIRVDYWNAQITIIAFCGATQFLITVDPAQIRETTFAKSLATHQAILNHRGELLESHIWTRSFDAFRRLICTACQPLFNKLASQDQTFSVQDYYLAQTYRICVVRRELCDSVLATSTELCERHITWNICPIDIVDLDPACLYLEMMKASQTFITRCPESVGMESRAVSNTGTPFCLKARTSTMIPSFNRELSILLRIGELQLNQDIRVSTLAGLLVLDDARVAAMAINWISGSPLITECLLRQNEQYHRQWEDQMRDIVATLHSNGIVWGDVNPSNIMIDDEHNAWVIDFGGSYNVEFIDAENEGTEIGDWQGVNRIFKKWLPDQNKLFVL